MAVKSKVKRRIKVAMPKRRKDYSKNRKSPVELFGILKDKIFYENDEVLIN